MDISKSTGTGGAAFEHTVVQQDGSTHTLYFGYIAYGKGHAPAGGHKPVKIIQHAVTTSSFNLAATFSEKLENVDFVLSVFIEMSGKALSNSEYETAKRMALDAAQTNTNLSLLALVNIWLTVPELREFATALATASIPGYQGTLLEHRAVVGKSGEGMSHLFDEIQKRQMREGRKWNPGSDTATAKSEPYYRQFFKRHKKR